MISLRLPGREAIGATPLSSVALSRCTSLLGRLAMVGLCALPAGAAATGSRSHHVTPALTPLHYTERSFAAPHGGKPTGKAAARHGSSASGTRPKANGKAAGAPAAAKRSSRRGKDADYDPSIPMLRAGRGQLRGSQVREGQLRGDQEVVGKGVRGSGAAGRSAQARFAPRGRRIPLPAPDRDLSSREDSVVAEVTGSSAHGDTLAHLHRRAAGHPGAQFPAASVRPVIVASGAYPRPSVSAAPSGPAPVERRTAPTVVASAAYATGTAHTDDDDLDRPVEVAGHPNGPAGSISPVTVQARSAGPHVARGNGNTNGSAPSQVVDGFGSELALAPAPPSDRPGLTRRRNHPIPASALAEDNRASAPAVLAANLPSTLAERDAVTAGAIAPSVLSSNLPDIYDGNGNLAMPAPLRGTREILLHQNTMADNDGLERIQNDAQLDHLRATHQLVDLPVSASLHVNDTLPFNRRCARPWTALFAQDIARDFYARFHQPLWVTSAVRTVAFQSRLIRVNGNAAGLYGDFASPHLTGQAIDFGKNGMTAAQIAWMRSYLLPFIQSGKIDVEEEFQQACFHMSVYRSYAGGRRIVNLVTQAAAQPVAPSGYPPTRPSMPPSSRSVDVLTNPELTDTE